MIQLDTLISKVHNERAEVFDESPNQSKRWLLHLVSD